MPHIILEHSIDDRTSFDILAVMQALHETASATGVVRAEDLKIRAIRYTDYLVGGRPDSFCHVSVYMLEGRTSEQKVAVSEALRATMIRLLPLIVSLSVDIRDMDAVAYKKRLKP